MSVAARLEGVSKRFGQTVALDGVSFGVTGPGVTGFLGLNGAGKTTAMKVLMGFLAPDSGRIELLGGERSEARQRSLAARIGYLPQETGFLNWMTGREFLSFCAELFPPRESVKDTVESLLERLSLADAANRRIGGYSGGMKQRLGIATALVNEPELLLLDEPVSSLDPAGRAEVLEMIAELGQERAVFMSTHILNDIERVSRAVVVIHKGNVIAQGPTGELLDRHMVNAVELVVSCPGGSPSPALSALPCVTAVISEEQHGSETMLRLAVNSPEEAGKQIPAAIASLNAVLKRYAADRPTLEDVFLGLVGEGGGQ